MWLSSVQRAHPAGEKIHHGDESVTVMRVDGTMNGDKQEITAASAAPCRCNRRRAASITGDSASLATDATSQDRRTSLGVKSSERNDVVKSYTYRR